MSEMWKQWQGRIVDGRFPLQEYLGGSDHSAVFLTVMQRGTGDPEKVAIKLISADAADAEAQLQRWKSVRELTHPTLLRIFEAGRYKLDDTKLLYVVEEYADENLSQILPDRALTAKETGGMLPPVLRVLQFVHDKGLVHGRIQPSNILATADELKLSSDSLASQSERRTVDATSAYNPPESAAGERTAATDVWQLGMTLIEVLTQRLPAWDRTRSKAPEVPAAVPEPFREIAGCCLRADAGKRWSIAQILGRLGEALPKTTAVVRPERVVSAPVRSDAPKATAKWPYALALAAVLAIGIFLIARPKSSSAPPESQVTQVPAAEPAPSSTVPENPKAERATTQARANENTAGNVDGNGVVRRVMPHVSPGALRTIHGKIRIRIKVQVDAAGNVTETKVESGGPSAYFRRLATDAARDWKFVPEKPEDPPGERAWRLQFLFTRGGTDASAERVKR